MPKIALTRGKTTVVDRETYEAYGHLKWYAALCDGKFYATRFDESRKCVRLHRLVLGAKTGEHVDHVNGDTLDNRAKNIRTCTQTQNNANAKKRGGTSSKYKGVSWCAKKNKWQVFVGRQWVGYFTSQKYAAAVYNRLAKAKYGVFAKVNSI